ncbi:AAA family ATPase [Rhodococcus sp. IEGM 1379]|uniref:ATP-binding protein n=1 Tax=Rhodococcus sp. IEGM 1379 TaxID=3047086 RepID=UPI0024B7F077|nr:AAA family ATPase [Rhodococcus sp. IEGM 1379]MDI9917317.1 BTAD domain-containing putative transcriptional regulator [Rhodococcus sp. IEGM 1379]
METLAYLALHRHRDVALDELASVIWPQTRPKSWNATMRTVISRVRNTLEAASIPGDSVRSRLGYVQFSLPDSVTIDLETIRSHCRNSDIPASIRADRAHDAHKALAGEILRGVTGDWADDIRTECERLRIQALDIDATASIEVGAYDRAVYCAEELISIDPLRERAYRHAMRGYLGLGDRAQALDLATRCRQALSDNLGVAPSPETEQLFLTALRHTETYPAHPNSSTSSGPRRIRSTPIGIELELDIITRAWKEAALGVSQYVVVTGDAGTGKTTLVIEALKRAQHRDIDILFGRCSEDAIIAFEPFADAAAREFDALGVARSRQWLTENGSEILRLIPGAANRYGDLAPADTGGDDRALIVAAVHHWLTATSRSAPTILVIDDLHWASSTTHVLLRYLMKASATSTVCFVVTARTPSLSDPELNKTLNTATRLGNVHRIALKEFDVEHVRQLVDAYRSSLDPVALHRRTHGHPLFVTSILEDPQVGDSAPASILEFIRRTEHGLSTTAQTLLRLCAVIGSSISRDVLRLTTRNLDEIEFADALDELVHEHLVNQGDDSNRPALWSAEIIHQTAPTQTANDAITLRHPLVQEVVYGGISPSRRAAMHSLVGHALTELRTPTVLDDSARLAYHFSRGLLSDRLHARTYAQLAGDHAFNLGAFEDALAHYNHALNLSALEENTPQQCRLLIGLGRARRATRDMHARVIALSALAMATRLGDLALQVEAVLASERHGMMFVQQYSADIERIDLIEGICKAMVQTGRNRTVEYAILLTQIVIEHAWEDGSHRRDSLIARAAGIARDLGDGPLLARVSVAALIGLRTPHSSNVTATALTDLNNLVGARATMLHDVTTAVWLSRARLESGDLTGAAATLDFITDAHINGNPELDWLVNYGRLGLELAAGHLFECEARLERIRAIPPSPTDKDYYGRLLPAVTAFGTLRGNLQEIVDQSEMMVANFDSNPALRPALAVALIDVGAHNEAAELLSWYTPERLDEIPIDPMWLSTLTLIGRAAAEMSAAPLCKQIYHYLSSHAESTVLTWASIYGVVHHHLAHLAWGFGDLTRAGHHIADALTAHSERSFAGWAAESGYLSLRIRSAETGRVDKTLAAKVRTRANSIGATAVVRRVDLLAQSGYPL